MANELSSNWKKLQAKITGESTRSANGTLKRKSDGHASTHIKRQRTNTLPPKLATRSTKSEKKENEAMGTTQSSAIESTSKYAVSPSLSLWAEDNEISPEDLAQAYGLGTKDNSLLSSPENVNGGLSDDIQVGKYIAIDCEMVGIGDGGYESALARISFVDYHGNQVYDSYVRPTQRVTDWRTAVSGVSPKHMRFARPFDEVQAQALELLKGRILIGHDVKHDLAALMLKHPSNKIRDTSSYSGFKKYGHGRKPALRTLAQAILGVTIQDGAHSSIEDARVAMLLFRRFKSEFDTEYDHRFPMPPTPGQQSNGRSKSKKQKLRKG